MHGRCCLILFVVSVGRYCDETVQTGSSNQLSGGLIAVVVAVVVLAIVVLVLIALLLWLRTQNRHTGNYRPSSAEHKAGTLPLPTVAASSASSTPLHLVIGDSKEEVLV